MRKITEKNIQNITAGTKVIDKLDGEVMEITRIANGFFELGYILEDRNTLKENYMLLK